MFHQVILFILISISYGFQECEKGAYVKTSFGAAVVEFQPVDLNMSMSAHANILRNVKSLEYFIQEPSEVDILVFPEYGLTSTKIHTMTAKEFDHFAQEVPLHPFRPCVGHVSFWSILDHISCLAYKYKIYLVINLVTRDRGQYFNTALAFNRKGQIVGEYHKYNIYDEPFITKPSEAHVVTFDTDFGAKIGLMICFDINYADPALSLVEQVDAIAYPTAWTDELPFLTG